MALSMDQKKEMEDKNMKENLALALIQLALYEILFPWIFACASSQEAWKVLKVNYQGNAQVKEVKL